MYEIDMLLQQLVRRLPSVCRMHFMLHCVLEDILKMASQIEDIFYDQRDG